MDHTANYCLLAAAAVAVVAMVAAFFVGAVVAGVALVAGIQVGVQVRAGQSKLFPNFEAFLENFVSTKLKRAATVRQQDQAGAGDGDEGNEASRAPKAQLEL